MYNIVFFLIVLFIVADFLLERVLALLNAKKIGIAIPPILEGIYDNEKYQKQQRYSFVNYKFGIFTSSFNVFILLIMFAFGLFGLLDGVLRGVIENELLLTLVFFGVLFFANDILNTPFDYHQTFVIEEKFEFNKMSKGLFFIDKLKGVFLAVIIGGAILSVITLIYQWLPNYFWLLAWAVIAFFNVFLMMFYSEWIVPLFNKQTPLEEGELRTKIEEFSKKADFDLVNIFVIDGSKRSTKANAYFSGLGAKKRIVLYDTLIHELTADEIVAVLAHEIGHYKKKHTLVMLFLSLINMLVMFAVLGWFLGSPLIAQALGSTISSFHLGLLAFGILYSPVSTVLSLGVNMLSRKNEYEADAYAAQFGLSEYLISALKKLSAKSLSNLQPHPAYVFVHYSHPTLLQRINALTQK
ncbi:MAG: M48 family metallopeptidase [Paludibacteraceae bacterium]|nr:M48 family metallopeptidase [Paludibacteraceae bacterium]MBP6435815.1 M48 family metallopeptidase [Paludibacteraceae bacterium]MBP8627066.1 M48 family metallopeptidase [Paludibacteraceae bacterium]MBP9647995.1 M48 family metallopeptidase [Paludibacteraceae bacterium]MBP9970786.1 M48 family metallopeptidase [Paludibacteraceae bacterium]